MIKAANDNFKTKHIQDPFHRIFAEGYLDPHPAMNAALYNVGCRYREDFYHTGRNYLQAANYERPSVSCGQFDPHRDLTIGERISDKDRPYRMARATLEAVGLAELLDDVLITDMPIAEAGRKYSGRKQEQQARCAASTALIIGLRLLARYYKIPTAVAA